MSAPCLFHGVSHPDGEAECIQASLVYPTQTVRLSVYRRDSSEVQQIVSDMESLDDEGIDDEGIDICNIRWLPNIIFLEAFLGRFEEANFFL